MTSPASPTTATPEPAAHRDTAHPAGGAPTPTARRRPTAPRRDRRTGRPGVRQGRDAVPARRSPDVRAGARKVVSLTGAGIARLRTMLGQIVWFACLLAATALLLGAVLVVLEANTRNALVEAVLRAADWADLGVFSRTAGVKQFTGDGAVVKNAITNWGLGAVAWLVVGRLARRILTP